jgi:hypothetical protein
MTTQCCAVNKLTGRVKHKLQQGGIFWFAPGALAWTRERVDRFMDNDLRPIDEYDTYQWPLPVEGKRLPYSPKRRYEEREAYFRRTIDEPAAEREEKARLRKAEREKTRLSKA